MMRIRHVQKIKIKPWQLLTFQGWLLSLVFIIDFFVGEVSVIEGFRKEMAIPQQLLIGLGTGLVGAKIILFLVNNELNKKLIHLSILSQSKPFLLLFYCLVIGVCEELFFRSLLLPVAGIFWSSVFFSLAHSQFWMASDAFKKSMITGGIFIMLGLGFGILFLLQGFYSACIAHLTVDFIILFEFKRRYHKVKGFRKTDGLKNNSRKTYDLTKKI